MIKTLFATMVALITTALAVQPAGAHTAMLQASPDRNATVGGTIGFVDLAFLDPVTDSVVTVTFNGAPVPGRTRVADGQLITFALEQPLTQPGRYQVTYEMISADGDFTTGGFFFTFDPAAAQPSRLEQPDSDRFSTTTLALSGAGLLAIVGLLALLVRRVSGQRRRHVLETTSIHELDAPYHPHR